MAENSASRDVGRPRPNLNGHVVFDKDDELVVANAIANGLRPTNGADPDSGDHGFVVVLIGLCLIADIDVYARQMRRLEGLADRGVLELVEHGPQFEIGTVGPGDEAGQSLEQTPR